MAELRPATPREVVRAVRQRLIDAVPMAPSRVILCACEPDDVPHAGAQQDVLLRLEGESPAGTFDGGGRYVDLRRRTFAVWPRTRMSLDPVGSDLERLTRDTIGHLELETAIDDALAGWLAEDGDDAIALPVDIGTFSTPVRDRGDASWVRSRLEFSVTYLKARSLPEREVPQ